MAGNRTTQPRRSPARAKVKSPSRGIRALKQLSFPAPLKILFAALHNGYYRNLDSVVEELARRGHAIYLGAERADTAFGGQPIVERLAASYSNVVHGPTPSREADSLFLTSKIRFGSDYLHYLGPIYPLASGLRPLARERTPTGIVRVSRLPVLDSELARRLMRRALDTIDRAAPPSPAIERFLDAQRPDLVVITPLIGLVASSQLDLLRSARARRVPTAVVVSSWDNLSSKAIIRDVPDGLFVWNHTQKWEATDMHGVPADRVVVTGAQCFDHWFNRPPSRSRSEFIRDAGLNDERPYVMWVCSALLPSSPREPDVVVRWVSQLRASRDPRVRDVPILIRPHPSRTDEWASVDWRRFGNITMFGSAPVEEQARTDYFDSLYNAGAVVGITTTAFLDAAVVGRPVMSFLADDLRQEHEDSVHFQYLLNVESGLLTLAGSLEEHERQLAAMLDGPPAEVLERQRRFVNAFVRPNGMEVPATGIVVEALERLTSTSPVGVAPSVFGRTGLRLLRALEKTPRWRTLLLDEREAETAARQNEKARRRAEALARKQLQRAEKARRAARKRRRHQWGSSRPSHGGSR